MYTALLLMLVLQGSLCTTSTVPRQTGLMCYSCSGVTSPHHCSRTVQCAADEECHAEGIIADDGSVFYNSGCQKTQICQAAARGRRSDIQVCEGCCGTDLCNLDLCQQTNDTSTPGAQCYQCDDVTSPLACHTRVTCAHGQQCIVQEYVSSQLEIRYRLGCETKQKCDLIQKYTNVVKRTTQICNECCHSPGCNRHLCYNEDNFTQPAPPHNNTCVDLPDVDCAQADVDLDICESHAPAATKFCRKFCGYCSADGSTTPAPTANSGSTPDPCRDSPDVDCRDMDSNLHLCSKPSSPPTMLYCPRYCGVCGSTGATTTPATAGTTPDPCRDSHDIDCKDMNDTLNICGQPNSPPTKLYCPKFCKLCTPSSSNGPSSTPAVALGTTTDPCHDSPNVDCKQMDDNLKICANPSPPTKLYCSKYCKIC